VSTRAIGLWLVSVTGCGLTTGRMTVEPVALSAQKPGNVALYVAVSDRGAGVLGLDAHAFKIYEDGVPLDNDQIKLTLLPANSAVAHHAALLVDMSKTLSPDEKKALSASLRSFIVGLRQRQAVSLYAFDGSEKAHLVAEYARDARPEPDEKDTSMERLLAFSRKDSSSSLFSALMDGARKLDVALKAEGRQIESGTVIVIARNPDLAGRVEDGKVRDFIANSPHQFLLLTVGTWANSTNLEFIGKNGNSRAASVNTLTSPLASLKNKVDDAYFRNYLVSYCSPARAGTRELRLEVSTRDENGKKDLGSYQTHFDANGFGPGCDPLAAPHFARAVNTETGTRSAGSGGRIAESLLFDWQRAAERPLVERRQNRGTTARPGLRVSYSPARAIRGSGS